MKLWLKTLYNGGVGYTDHQVGRLLETIKDLDIYDDALIILTNDHGEEFWDHGGWQHGHNLHNELIAAPLIVKLPVPDVLSVIVIPVPLEFILAVTSMEPELLI